MENWEETEPCFPQLNFSCMTPKRTLTEAALIYTVPCFIALLTVTLNLLVIISISHFKQLHTPTNFLLLSLAVSDFFVGILLSFRITLIEGCWFLGDFMCVFHLYILFIITGVSVGNMVLISVDRYVAICDPLHYPSKVTVRGATVCICLCWVFSFLHFSCTMTDNLKNAGGYNSCIGECVIILNYITIVSDLILTFIIPVTVIIVLYMRVFVVAVTQARAMQSHITVVTLNHPKRNTTKKSELKAARTLGVVVVAFLICLCPYYISSIAGHGSLFVINSVNIDGWFFSLNSCLNPIIYAFCYPWFRKSIKLIVTFKILQSDSCDANIL